MSKKITLKLIVIGFLGLLLWIPLLLEQGVIYERMSYRDQVTHDIASKWTGNQTITGPVMILPWQLEYTEKQWNDTTKSYLLVHKKKQGQYLLLPNQFDSQVNINNSTRNRGIYQIPVYNGTVEMSGSFQRTKLHKYQQDLEAKYKGSLSWGDAKLSILVSDMRGIVSEPTSDWNGNSLSFAAGSGLKSSTQGIHAELGSWADESETTHFFFNLQIKGMERLMITPAGDNSSISMSSDWPHPSFNGRHLPTDYTVEDTGFQANWKTSPFAGDLASVLKECQNSNYCDFTSHAVGTDFIDPIDMYSQAERSIKYGLLFIAVTFMLFFLFEVLKNLQIHVIQYGMVGLALALFYLLLVSLSEHIAFIWAYVIATIACCLLLGLYLSAVLQSKARGYWFATGIAGLYGLLYMIISSEGFALLMGSILIFATLAVSMLTTRNVDWYQLSRSTPQNSPEGEKSDLEGKTIQA